MWIPERPEARFCSQFATSLAAQPSRPKAESACFSGTVPARPRFDRRAAASDGAVLRTGRLDPACGLLDPEEWREAVAYSVVYDARTGGFERQKPSEYPPFVKKKAGDAESLS